MTAGPAQAFEGKYWVFVGTYTGEKSKGIYRAEFDPSTGKLGEPTLAGEVASPSFLAIHPTGQYLYSVSEISGFDGKKGGAVAAFALDPKSGSLRLLDKESTIGDGPCHLVVDATGKTVLVANYGGGSVAALPIGPDGKLDPASSFIQHTGSSVNPNRQKEPHAHSINVDKANRYAFAADLGLDKILVYKLDPSQGTLTPNDPPAAALKPGSGPRHFAFHPSGKYAYAINELTSTMTAFEYEPETGKLSEIQTISCLPAGFEGTSYTAEVQVHPSGKFVYGSNRGHDSLVIYKVDPSTGRLAVVGHASTQGKNPRNFTVDPTGQYILAANQETDNIVVFKVDPSTGELTPTGQQISVGKPVCIRFLPQGE